MGAPHPDFAGCLDAAIRKFPTNIKNYPHGFANPSPICKRQDALNRMNPRPDMNYPIGLRIYLWLLSEPSSPRFAKPLGPPEGKHRALTDFSYLAPGVLRRLIERYFPVNFARG